MGMYSAITSLREIEAGQAVGYAQTWHAKRTSIIATVAIGYGDGYPRNAASGTPVLVNGKRAEPCWPRVYGHDYLRCDRSAGRSQ